MQKYLVLDIRVSSRDIPETPVENGMMWKTWSAEPTPSPEDWLYP